MKKRVSQILNFIFDIGVFIDVCWLIMIELSQFFMFWPGRDYRDSWYYVNNFWKSFLQIYFHKLFYKG